LNAAALEFEHLMMRQRAQRELNNIKEQKVVVSVLYVRVGTGLQCDWYQDVYF